MPQTHSRFIPVALCAKPDAVPVSLTGSVMVHFAALQALGVRQLVCVVAYVAWSVYYRTDRYSPSFRSHDINKLRKVLGGCQGRCWKTHGPMSARDQAESEGDPVRALPCESFCSLSAGLARLGSLSSLTKFWFFHMLRHAQPRARTTAVWSRTDGVECRMHVQGFGDGILVSSDIG